jgi:hypothetical protein
MEAEQILKRIGYDNNSITAIELWIAKEVYKLAMEDFAALRQPPVIGSVCDGCGSKFDAMDISVGICYCCQKEIKQTDL